MMFNMDKKQLGALGEKIAVNYLKKQGYKILDKNYPKSWDGIKKGEIDIIVKKDDAINFIEVKTLAVQGAYNQNFRPEEKVDWEKQRKIIKTAQVWLAKNKIPLESRWQVDVISIKMNLSSGKAKLRHFKNVSA